MKEYQGLKHQASIDFRFLEKPRASPTVCYISLAKSCVLASCYNYLPSSKEAISKNLLYFTCQIKKEDGSPDSVVDW